MSWTLVGIVAVVATASRGSHAFGAARDRDRVDGRSWVRLCTLTKNGGSSRVDVAMPCGVRVENDRSDTLDRPDGGFVRIDRGDAENEGPERPETSTGRTADDAFENVGGDPSEIVPGNVGVRRNDSKNRANATEERVAGIHDRNDGESSDYDDDDDDESTTVLENGEYPEPAVGDGAIPVGYGESDGGVDYEDGVVVRVEDDRRNELDKRHGSVAKVMLEYLADAKNQFYNRIHNMLRFLQNAFFTGRLHNRVRRDLIEPQIFPNAAGRQMNNKIKTITSVIMKPTFERSMMTMSFLMFGVFVIQVVQKLMQTLQQSNGSTSVGNSVSESLPTLSSGIF